jgi:hypothetical protein
MGYFNLPFGVRVSNNQPLDGDRYIAVDLAARDSLITNGRAYEGLQVYIESGDTANTGLWLLSVLGVDVASSSWTKIDVGGVGGSTTLSGLTDVTISSANSGDTLIFDNGIWVNSAITETTMLAGTGITFTNTPGFISINNSKYVSGFTINTLSNELTIELADSTTFVTDLGYLVDTDSYVTGGTFLPISGGTIRFTTNSGYSFDVTGISNASLESLSDTLITSPTDNQVLVYTGGTWINSAVTGMGTDDWIDADIVPTKEVGGVSIGETQYSGTTFEDIFRHILAPTIDPYISSVQSVSIGGVLTNPIEVGTYFTMTLSNSFNKGVIKSQENYPTETNVDLVGNINTTTYSGVGVTGNNVAYSATTGTMTWTVSVDYDSGISAYYDSDANIAHNLDVSRVAGTTANSRSRIGRYNYWFGVSGDTMPLDSTTIRTFSHNFDTEGDLVFNISIPSGTTDVGFYLRDSITDDSDITVTYVESSSADVTSTFTPSSGTTINDASGSPVNYKVFRTHIGSTGYPEDATYHVVVNR